MNSFWVNLARFPPCGVRLLARTEGRHPRILEDAELAELSGLSIETIQMLQWMPNWENVPVRTMYKFLKGSRMDIDSSADMKRCNQYMRKSARQPKSWMYLKRHAAWDAKWARMYALWQRSVTVRKRSA